MVVSPLLGCPQRIDSRETLLGSAAPFSVGAFVSDGLVHLHHGSDRDGR
jgi:hypothetical protein